MAGLGRLRTPLDHPRRARTCELDDQVHWLKPIENAHAIPISKAKHSAQVVRLLVREVNAVCSKARRARPAADAY